MTWQFRTIYSDWPCSYWRVSIGMLPPKVVTTHIEIKFEILVNTQWIPVIILCDYDHRLTFSYSGEPKKHRVFHYSDYLEPIQPQKADIFVHIADKMSNTRTLLMHIATSTPEILECLEELRTVWLHFRELIGFDPKRLTTDITNDE